MTMHTTLRAGLLACCVLTVPGYAAPIMNGPAVPNTALAAQVGKQLVAGRASHGLDQDHGFALVQQHPGVLGTEVVRAAHTYKGVPVFGSESVLVVDVKGKILAESSSERRQHLGRGPANKLRGLTADFPVAPVLPHASAIAAALASLASTMDMPKHVKPPVAWLPRPASARAT
jgi:hypothetical protein